MSEWASEHEFPLPDGSGVWLVRAYEFPDPDSAYAEWVRVKEALSVEGDGNFSCWRTMLPDGSAHMVVVCGRPEVLPEVRGVSTDIDYENARAFALRRARKGMDAFDENPDAESFSHEDHYDAPVQIDPASGYVKRWYRPT
jgi:hypothetical protein